MTMSEPTDLYYILSVKWTSPYVLTWYRDKGNGYTVELREAGKFTRAKSIELTRGVHGDALAIPRAEVDARATLMVHDNHICELRNLALEYIPREPMRFPAMESSGG